MCICDALFVFGIFLSFDSCQKCVHRRCRGEEAIPRYPPVQEAQGEALEKPHEAIPSSAGGAEEKSHEAIPSSVGGV